jgi:hypothetical protein
MKKFVNLSIILLGTLLMPLSWAVEQTEPTEADLVQAYTTYVQDMANIQDNLMAAAKGSKLSDDVRYRIHSLKKIACEKALGKPGYVCISKIDESYPLQQRMTSIHEDRIVHSSDGWIVMIPPRTYNRND